MTKTQEISRQILANVAKGMDVKAAIDAVLGAGTYEGIASDLYNTLRGGR